MLHLTLLFTFFQIFQDAARSAAGGTVILYNLTSLSQTPPFFRENAGHFPEKRHDFPDPFSYFPQSSAAFHRSSHLLKNPFRFPPVFSLKTAPILQNTPTAYRNEAKTGREPAFSHQNAAVAEVIFSVQEECQRAGNHFFCAADAAAGKGFYEGTRSFIKRIQPPQAMDQSPITCSDCILFFSLPTLTFWLK